MLTTLAIISTLLVINALLLLFSVNSSNAQTLDLKSVLPIDQSIKKGMTSNTIKPLTTDSLEVKRLRKALKEKELELEY